MSIAGSPPIARSGRTEGEFVGGILSNGTCRRVSPGGGAGTDSTFTVRGSTTPATRLTGILTDGPSNKLKLVKDGSNTLELRGTYPPTYLDGTTPVLPYSGGTTVKAGTLVMGIGMHAPVLSGAGGADIKGGRLVLDYVGGSTPADTVKGLLATAYPSNFASGQIRTTNTPDSAKGIGWKDDAASQQVTVAYTYYGDANLDGQVDISDLGALATAWQTSAVWSQGDFDYSGFVDISDLGKLATNWQLGVGAPLGPSFDEALASLGLAGVSVPEPAAMSLLAVCLAGAFTRRHRRQAAAAQR